MDTGRSAGMRDSMFPDTLTSVSEPVVLDAMAADADIELRMDFDEF